VHPCLCCVFVILLPGVPGRARSSVCDGPELRHGQTDVVNLYIRCNIKFLQSLCQNSART
jgi:hypothetical protein